MRSKTATSFANTKYLSNDISELENHIWFFENIKKDNNSSTEIRKCQK